MAPTSVRGGPTDASPFDEVEVGAERPASEPAPVPMDVSFLTHFNFPTPAFYRAGRTVSYVERLKADVTGFAVLRTAPWPRSTSEPEQLAGTRGTEGRVYIEGS